MTYQHIGVVGGGAWGTALAISAARAGRNVTLWEHDAANAAQLATERESLFLPGVRIDDAIAVTRDAAALARAEALLVVVPAQAMRAVVTALAPVVAGGTPLIVCAKGIEAGTHAFMSDIVAACAPKAVPAILSGPSFAADVARGLPTAVTLAAARRSIGGRAGAGARLGHVPALPFHRRARRRDRRRRQERAGDRRRHRRRAGARRQRRRGTDHARICRAGALRPGVRRAAGDA